MHVWRVVETLFPTWNSERVELDFVMSMRLIWVIKPRTNRRIFSKFEIEHFIRRNRSFFIFHHRSITRVSLEPWEEFRMISRRITKRSMPQCSESYCIIRAQTHIYIWRAQDTWVARAHTPWHGSHSSVDKLIRLRPYALVRPKIFVHFPLGITIFWCDTPAADWRPRACFYFVWYFRCYLLYSVVGISEKWISKRSWNILSPILCVYVLANIISHIADNILGCVWMLVPKLWSQNSIVINVF